MEPLSDKDKAIIGTLVSYVLMDKLEQKGIIDKKYFINH